MLDKTTVFYAHLSQYNNNLITLVPDKEHLRLQQLSSQSRKQLFILGRALLTQALTFLTGCGDYHIVYQKHGKPILHTKDNWQFNITHSGQHLLLAMRQQHPIGIDSEILKPRPYQRLAKKLFTPTEQEAIANAIDPMQAFYRYWTCYEAQIKYLGLSVFSELPEQPRRTLVSYRYNDLVFSLCSDTEIINTTCHQYTSQKNQPFSPIAPILLT